MCIRDRDRGGSQLGAYHSILVSIKLNFIVTPKQGGGGLKEKMSTPSASVLVEATGRYSPGGVIVCMEGGI